MKSRIINTFVSIIFTGMIFFIGVSSVFAGPMSPRSGYITSSTGAPIAGIKVVEYTDHCPSDYVHSVIIPQCPKVTECHAERSTRTDANGYYYLEPMTPPSDPNDPCNLNKWWNFTCSNPAVFVKVVPDDVQAAKNKDIIIKQVHAQEPNPACVPIKHQTDNASYSIDTDLKCDPVKACGALCTKTSECAGQYDGCTVCGSEGVCKPPACGDLCEKDADCAGSKDSCKLCIAGADGVKKCSAPPACNTACTTNAQCERATGGCTACLPNDTGEGSACKTPPACGTACTKDAQCSGAKNDCTNCSGGKCSSFSENMCGCDGMDFAVADGADTFFPGSDVSFIAFGVVPGKDWKGSAAGAVTSATITSMTLSLYQSSLSDPNKATRIAQSTAITPEVVENTAAKVRYKVTWNQKIPSTVPSGSLFRVQADIKCSAKPGVLGASTNQSGNIYTDIIKTVKGMLTNTKTILGDTTQDNQQADTFFPGAKISEKSCSILKFYFD